MHFHSRKCICNVAAKWLPFCLGLIVLSYSVIMVWQQSLHIRNMHTRRLLHNRVKFLETEWVFTGILWFRHPHKIVAEISLMKLPSDECHWTLLMISQHWFRQWLGAVRQQALTWTNVDSDLCRQMPSLGLNELNSFSCMKVIVFWFRFYNNLFARSRQQSVSIGSDSDFMLHRWYTQGSTNLQQPSKWKYQLGKWIWSNFFSILYISRIIKKI